jgi:hypothetical protein
MYCHNNRNTDRKQIVVPACTKCAKVSTAQSTVYHCDDYNWDEYRIK